MYRAKFPSDRENVGWKYGLKPKANIEEKLDLSFSYKQMRRKLNETFNLNSH